MSGRIPVPCGFASCRAEATLFYRRDSRFAWDGPTRKEFAARCAGHAGNALRADNQGDWTIGTYEDYVVDAVLKL